MEHVTTVLIADSADDFCTALTAALQHADGFQVVGTANDGEQAIRMVEERKPDVLVLDLMLSKKDGISVLKAVSGMEHRPITLATSVFVTQYVSAAAANLGVRYLMLKPCDMTALVERLEEIRGGDSQKAAEKRRPDKTSIESMVTGIIHEIGVPAHIKGYQYLREAILITAADPSVLNKAVTKILYPEIARRYGTTALRVERCIRSAIEIAWDRASPETLPKYFGCTVSSQRGKPSNAEFIALLAERLTLEDDQALRA